jgi:hypothetical protein
MSCTENCNQVRNCNCCAECNKTKFDSTYLKEVKMKNPILVTAMLVVILMACAKKEDATPSAQPAEAAPSAQPAEAAK